MAIRDLMFNQESAVIIIFSPARDYSRNYYQRWHIIHKICESTVAMSAGLCPGTSRSRTSTHLGYDRFPKQV